MGTRDLFRGAARSVARHALDDLDARPGFISRAGKAGDGLPWPQPAAKGRPSSAPGGIADTAQAVRAGRLSASAVIARALDRIRALDHQLRAFVVTLDARARREAE